MKLSAAIFDMDGTLIDSLIFWDVLWEEFSRRYGYFRPDPEADRTVRTISMKNAMYYIHDRFGLGHDGEELYRLANGMLEAFYEQQVELKPGVMEFLVRCRELGIKMCVASASDLRLVRVAMKRCGIADFFSAVISCNDIGKGKEAPDVYLAALDHLGTPMQETWVFEDSYVALQTAARAGFPTVGVYDRFGFRQDIMRDTATVYIGEGDTWMKVIDHEEVLA